MLSAGLLRRIRWKRVFEKFFPDRLLSLDRVKEWTEVCLRKTKTKSCSPYALLLALDTYALARVDRDRLRRIRGTTALLYASQADSYPTPDNQVAEICLRKTKTKSCSPYALLLALDTYALARVDRDRLRRIRGTASIASCFPGRFLSPFGARSLSRKTKTKRYLTFQQLVFGSVASRVRMSLVFILGRTFVTTKKIPIGDFYFVLFFVF